MLTIPVFRFMTSRNRPLRFLIEDYDDVYDASRLSQWVDHDRQLSIVASKQSGNETFTWPTCHSRFSIRQLLVVSWEHTWLWTVVSESHVVKIQNVKPSDFAHWYVLWDIYVSTSLRPTDWNLKMNVRRMKPHQHPSNALYRGHGSKSRCQESIIYLESIHCRW